MKCYLQNQKKNNIPKYDDYIDVTTFDHVFENMRNGDYLCEVEIPNDAKCYIQSDKYSKKIKTNKVTVKKITHIDDLDQWDNESSSIEAIKQNGLLLKFVKKQTYDICLEAVSQNGLALEYVETQTATLCFRAAKQNCESIKFADRDFYVKEGNVTNTWYTFNGYTEQISDLKFHS